MLGLPFACFDVRELLDLLKVECGFAEHALDLVGSVLLDLEAEVDFPAFLAGAFGFAVLAGAVDWGDFERLEV